MNHPFKWYAEPKPNETWRSYRSMKPEHQAGMAVSVLAVALFGVVVLCIVWGAACGITHGC